MTADDKHSFRYLMLRVNRSLDEKSPILPVFTELQEVIHPQMARIDITNSTQSNEFSCRRKKSLDDWLHILSTINYATMASIWTSKTRWRLVACLLLIPFEIHNNPQVVKKYADLKLLDMIPDFSTLGMYPSSYATIERSLEYK